MRFGFWPEKTRGLTFYTSTVTNIQTGSIASGDSKTGVSVNEVCFLESNFDTPRDPFERFDK